MPPKTEKKAEAAVEPAAAPAPPTPPGLGNMGRQLVLMGAMWSSHKVDWTKPDTLTMLLTAFGAVVVTGILLLQYTIGRAYKAKDTSRVVDPGEGPYMPEKAEDGTVSAMDYEVGKLKELKMQFMMSVGIVTFLHIKYAVV